MRSRLLLVLALALLPAAAMARSAGHYLTVNGKTPQAGGRMLITGDLEKGKLYSFEVRWRCDEDADTLYQAYSKLPENHAFSFGKAFSFSFKSADWKNKTTGDDMKGKVTFTLAGKVKRTDAKHTSGNGSVTIKAPGCTVAKQTWSGTGRIARR